MANATEARPNERAIARAVPSWVDKLKVGLQRTAQADGEPPAAEPLAAAPAGEPALLAPPVEVPSAPAAAHREPERRELRRSHAPSARRPRAEPAEAPSFAAGADRRSTVVKLLLPGGRTILAVLPAVPRVGEIVDVAEEGRAASSPHDVLAVRWGVHAAGGFTGVTLELRPRS